jgi:DNA primase
LPRLRQGWRRHPFIRELEHLGFTEAVERLAQQAGVALRYEGDSPAERRAAARRIALIKANEEAARLFSSMLADGREAEEAREYVKGRGISPESLERFGIGYAPTYPDFLLKRMTREFSPEILLEAGLATRGDEGSVRDRFRGRITFPIHDLQGRGIGFGARILPTDARASEQAKYLNTAETPIYKKNEVLFNLAGARPHRTQRRGLRGRGIHRRDRLVQAGIGTPWPHAARRWEARTSVC